MLVVLTFSWATNANAQKFQVVDPINPADLVYSYSGDSGCELVAFGIFLIGSDPDPCHVGIFTGGNSVTEADDSVLHAVHPALLTEFESRGTPPNGFRGARTTVVAP